MSQKPNAEAGNHTSPMLRLSNINTYYGAIHILEDVELEIYPGELICLLGGNASGKSTTLKTVLGIVKPVTGTVEYLGEAVQDRSTSYRVERGMAVVPENRRIFGDMSVYENLLMGAYLRRDNDGIKADLERILGLFPRLKERARQMGGTLSGGEQQMLAMGRALMSRPKLMLMDEPSMGLAPILVEQSFEIIQRINQQGTTIFMVEQNANMALSIANRGYVLQTGRIVLADKSENLLNNEEMRRAYLGH
ncbi:MAG TPA: ABC transporter ATP-binding protein [Anaerolineae bacterium]|jgi:branched-chain amino acid transport system ATP-binding protein